MEKETKHDKFKRVATKRVNEILKKIRNLENCSNITSYEYSDVKLIRYLVKLKNN